MRCDLRMKINRVHSLLLQAHGRTFQPTAIKSAFFQSLTAHTKPRGTVGAPGKLGSVRRLP